MKNCICCHTPLPTGEIFLVLSGRFSEEGDFLATGTEGYLCPSCHGRIEEERIGAIRVGDTLIRAA